MRKVLNFMIVLMVIVGAYDLYAIEQFSRVKVWGREVLTKDDLNAEFDAIINGLNTKLLNGTTTFTIIAGDSILVEGRATIDTLRVRTIFLLEGDIVPDADGLYNIGTLTARIDTLFSQDIIALKTRTDSLSTDSLSVFNGKANFAGTTITDLGTVTTANIDGGTVDGVTIGGNSASPITATTLKGDSLNIGSGDLIVAPTQNEMRYGGNTILGTTSTAPNSTLEVYASQPTMRISGSRSGSDGDIAYLTFWNRASDIYAFISAYRSGADNSTALRIYTTDSGTPAEKWRFAPDGNTTIDVDGTMNAGDHDLEIRNGASFSEIDAGETTFANSSTKTIKENFVTITADDIRDDFMELQVQRYNFKPAAFLNVAVIDSAFADTIKAKQLGLSRSDIDFVKQRAIAVQTREHQRANQAAQKKRVSVMAEDFYPISTKLRPTQADSGKIYGDDQIAALIVMVQSLQNQVDSLKALHK